MIVIFDTETGICAIKVIVLLLADHPKDLDTTGKVLYAPQLLSLRRSFRFVMFSLVKATTLAGRINKSLQAEISHFFLSVTSRETVSFRQIGHRHKSMPKRERDTDVPSAVQ